MAVSVAQVAFGGPACKGLFVSSMQNFKSIVRKARVLPICSIVILQPIL